MYAEVGPQVRSATVMPPSNVDPVHYSSLIHHDQSTAKDPTGMSTLKTALEHQLSHVSCGKPTSPWSYSAWYYCLCVPVIHHKTS